ncbi:MAG: exopolyphosphatase [Bacteroidetes bacterium]|nr:exopolyphosphatase [Bacteroidota bacterium]MBS1541454.1 exopolyphosphatase [Bacteroidota bacterium]
MTKTAIIDMGTNTFHLLVAAWNSSHYTILWQEQLPTRLGAGSSNDNKISSEAVDRALEALTYFKNKAEELGAGKILAIGTSALRQAHNAKSVVEQIEKTTSIRAQVISGMQEASLIYEGVNLALQLGTEKALMVDIGGGSVEFIIGNGQEIFWKESFEIGGLRLVEQFQLHDPILATEIESLSHYFEKQLQPLFAQIEIHRPALLAGSAGSFDTLSDIYCAQQGLDLPRTPEKPFDIASLPPIYTELISKNRRERLNIPGMIELRVDMMVPACCLIKFIVEKFQLKKIRVSSFSLKEGVLASLMKGKIS